MKGRVFSRARPAEAMARDTLLEVKERMGLLHKDHARITSK